MRKRPHTTSVSRVEQGTPVAGAAVTHGRLWLSAGLVAATCLLAASRPAAISAHAGEPVARDQRLTVLLSAHEAFAEPGPTARPLELVEQRRPLTGEQTVLPVLGDRRGPAGAEWLHVRLPGRPNGSTGWIRRRATRAATTSWHIVVDTTTRRVIVYHDSVAVRTIEAVVGKPSTPTPRGEYFVEEDLELPATAVGAPFALALSARSNVLQEFDGGPGQIALHGLGNVGGVLGTAVSHGCVRLDSVTMRWLVLRIGPGVPVTITG